MYIQLIRRRQCVLERQPGNVRVRGENPKKTKSLPINRGLRDRMPRGRKCFHPLRDNQLMLSAFVRE